MLLVECGCENDGNCWNSLIKVSCLERYSRTHPSVCVSVCVHTRAHAGLGLKAEGLGLLLPLLLVHKKEHPNGALLVPL